MDIRGYLTRLSSYLGEIYAIGSSPIRIEVAGDEVALDADKAISCGLIVNELVSNSLKHAFPGNRGGSIAIRIQARGGGEMSLTESDDGIGFPPEFDPLRAASMGWQLIRTLALQLRRPGRNTKGRREGGGGACVQIFFPLPKPKSPSSAKAES